MRGSGQGRDYRPTNAPRLYLEPEKYLNLAFRMGFQPRDHNVLDALRRLSGVRANIVPEEFATTGSKSQSEFGMQQSERTEYEELWNRHISM